MARYGSKSAETWLIYSKILHPILIYYIATNNMCVYILINGASGVELERIGGAWLISKYLTRLLQE